jgi:carbon monoxide dehydrogenase subunit G
MKLTDSCALPARPEVVWAALNDPKVLCAALPGCKSLEMRDEQHFESTIQVRVGPIAATFRGEVELADLDAPRAYTLIGRGNAGAVGFAAMKARVSLEAQGDTTLLHYDAEVEIGGKLMSVGARLIESVAAKNIESFFKAFARQLEESTAGAAPQAVATTAGPAVEAVAQSNDTAAAKPDASGHTGTAVEHTAPAAAFTPPRAVMSVAGDAPQRRMIWAVGAAAGVTGFAAGVGGFVIGFLFAHAV